MSQKSLGILVAGGPAPGINSAIKAVVSAARTKDVSVKGFESGFEHILSGNVRYRSLSEENLEGIHLLGGCTLKQSRANLLNKKGLPDAEKIERAINVFDKEGISRLVTIGGEDTAYSAHLIAKYSCGRIMVAHLPKTIDNDLPLPEGIPTFGFTTAVEFATREVVNLIQDAHATNRWYIVVIMGRTAGHLALHTMVASGAPVVMIPEEFDSKNISFEQVTDVLCGRIRDIRNSKNVSHGVAIVSEGIGYKINTEDFKSLPGARAAFDEAMHLRMSEVPLAKLLRHRLEQVESAEIKPITFIEKDLGYELRSAPPVAYDIVYTQLLGCGAVGYFFQCAEMLGGSLITVENGKYKAQPLAGLLDESGKIGVRVVNKNSIFFSIAKSRMGVDVL